VLKVWRHSVVFYKGGRMKKGKIVYFKDKNLMHRFRVVAANGEIIAQSEQYSCKQAAQKGVAALLQVVITVLG
jgi:uncharacterized protein YegP (UPF0339 family)